MIHIPKDFKEFIELLNKNGVDFVLVGGYAVACHGHPRYTGDIDFFIERSQVNASRIVTSLVEFGFPEGEVSEKDFTEPNRIIQIGRPPLRIDLISTLDGVTWEEVRIDRVMMTLGDITIPVISLTNLRRNKASTGRHQDLADLEALSE